MKQRNRINRQYSAQLLDFGAYHEAFKGKAIEDRKTLDGVWYELNDEKLTEQSDRLIARVNLLFGMRFTIHGPCKEESIVVVNKVEFPAPIIRGKKRIMESQFTSQNLTDSKIASMYSFDSEEDVVKGRYKFTSYLRGIPIISKTIEVR